MTEKTSPSVMTEKIIVALDVPPDRAQTIVETTMDLVQLYKVGPVLWSQWGKECLKFFALKERKVFLDFKFHDIPNTVRQSTAVVLDLEGAEAVWGMTLHVSGGFAMLKSAVEARDSSRHPAKLFGVTVLTSLREKDLYRMGINRSVEAQVKKLADLALGADLDGVVASAREIAVVKKACGQSFLVAVPGIRLNGESGRTMDQKRPATPGEAVQAGADYLIVGRDIYLDENPREALEILLGAIKVSLKNR